MAIGIGGKGKGSGTGVSSQATASTTTSATGSTFFVLAICDFSTNFSATAVDDNKSNTYTQIGSEVTFNSSGGRARLYRCFNGAGGAGHIATVHTAAGSDIGAGFIEITGADTTNPLDQNGGRNDTASPFTLAAGLTTTQAAEALCACLAGNSGSNPATHAESGIGSMTIQLEETNGAGFWPWALATKIVSATGTFNPSFTQSGGSNAAVFLATFKELIAASGVQQQLMMLGAGS